MANPLINSGDAVLVVYMQYGVERILTPYPQRLYRRCRIAESRLVQLYREQPVWCRSQFMRHRCLSPDDEIQFRQLPPVSHTGHHEAYQGKGCRGHHL